MPKNWCFWIVVLGNTLESPLDCKDIKPVHPKGNQSWILIGKTDAEAEAPILWPTWCEEKTCLKRPWCWERLKAGGEGDDRGWDGWMASLIWWTGVWVSSGSWWWTGKPDVLQSMGSQRVRHDWVTELNSFIHCWWKWKYIQSLWKTVCQLLKKLNINGHIIEQFHLLIYTLDMWKYMSTQKLVAVFIKTKCGNNSNVYQLLKE